MKFRVTKYLELEIEVDAPDAAKAVIIATDIDEDKFEFVGADWDAELVEDSEK